LGISNDFAVPKLLKIVVSVGCGRYAKDSSKLDFIFEQVKKITGCVPVRAKAKKSVASFSVREGMITGVYVTLRNEAMYDFVDKLVYLTLPKVRDFRGLNEDAFDGNGNYNLGIKDHTVFFESDDNFSFGMNIAIITSAKVDEHCKSLMSHLNFPFKKKVHNV